MRRFLDFAEMRAVRRSVSLAMLVCVMLFASFSAVAQTTAEKTYYRTTPSGMATFYDASVDTVCKYAIEKYRANNNLTAAWTYYGASGSTALDTSGGCNYKVPPSTGLSNNGTWTRSLCPVATPYWDNTTKTCKATAPPPPPPACVAGTASTNTYYVSATPDSPTVYSPFNNGGKSSDGQCEVDNSDVVECYNVPPDLKTYCTYKGKLTGNPMAGSATNPLPGGPVKTTDAKRSDIPPFSPSQGSCPSGSVQGGISADGVPICMGTGSAPKNAPPPPPKAEATITEAMPDGSTKTTTTVTTTNSDGSKTVQSTITITQPDGTKTIDGTKSTGLTPAGGAGRDESAKDNEKYDLCKQNPMLTICRNSSVAGTCGTITCQGDAIQCATLRNIAAMECRQIEEKDKLTALPSTGLGNSILGGTDPMKGEIDGALKGTEVDLSQSALSDSPFLSSAICLADRSFTVGGRTISVSFARLCPALLPLRYAVLACSWIVAYLIVSRSILNA